MRKILAITLAVTVGTVAGTFGTERMRAVKGVWDTVQLVEEKIEWCDAQEDTSFTRCETWAELYAQGNLHSLPWLEIAVAPIGQLELMKNFIKIGYEL